jgi:uncharacterized membrane protein YiaA
MMSTSMSNEMEPRFPALMTISVIFKILAVVVAVVGVIAAFGSLFTAITALAKLGTFIGILFVAAIQTLVYWAIGDFLNAFISIEHNTYLTQQALQKTSMRTAA